MGLYNRSKLFFFTFSCPMLISDGQNKMLTSIRVQIHSHLLCSRVNEAKEIRERVRNYSGSITLSGIREFSVYKLVYNWIVVLADLINHTLFSRVNVRNFFAISFVCSSEQAGVKLVTPSLFASLFCLFCGGLRWWGASCCECFHHWNLHSVELKRRSRGILNNLVHTPV